MSWPLVIVQPGHKLPSLADTCGDFSDWMLDGMGRDAEGVRVICPHEGDALPDPGAVGAALVTGSGAMVTDQAGWMGDVAVWLGDLVQRSTPVLGICFGHQLLAHALGGEIADNPRGIEVGTVLTRPTPAAMDDPLFSGWPAQALVQASHQQAVTRLPDGAVSLAASEQDPHHAFRYGKAAWGVQFHPEFDAHIVAAYEQFYGPRLSAEYRSQQRASRAESPLARLILRRFSEISS